MNQAASSLPLPPLAWLVDLDGTLYRAAPMKRRMAMELALFGLHRARLLSQFRHAHEELRALQTKDPCASFAPSPYQEQLKRAATRTGKTVSEVSEVVSEWMIERPGRWLYKHRREDLVEEIRAFRQQGGLTALVSDYPAASKLKALGVTDLFDQVVANGETKELTRLKPSPDGYLLAAQRLGCQPPQCLVIGDRDDADGAAARAAGMQLRLI